MEKVLSAEHFYKLKCAILTRKLAEVAYKQALDELAKVQLEVGLAGVVVESTDDRTKTVQTRKI